MPDREPAVARTGLSASGGPCPDFLICRRDRYLLEHSPSCRVPGYLLITPLGGVRTLGDLAPPARQELAEALQAASLAIHLVIAPARVLCLHFGDGTAPLRFHLFPRTAQVAGEFLKAFPDHPDRLHHPFLLHWARVHYRAPAGLVWSAVGPYLPSLRATFLLAAGAGQARWGGPAGALARRDW